MHVIDKAKPKTLLHIVYDPKIYADKGFSSWVA